MSNQMNESDVVELTGKIMLVAVIILFTVLILVSFLHLYAKWFWSRADHNSRRPSGIGISADGQQLRAVHHGLDASVLKSIPAVVFSEQDAIECAVCLSQVSEGEKGRLLPKCKHGFHVECIDMWFQSHSTCPICRNPLSNLVVEETTIEIAPPEEVEMEVPVTDTVLFSEAPELPSTSASTRDIVIEIPKQMFIQQEQDSKSPSTATPTPTRMASFKRLFVSSSRDTRIDPTSAVEQASH